VKKALERAGASGRLLQRLLEQPGLVAAVRALDARTLGKLIDHVGLEDAGELVALARTEQLEQLFDDDLWRSERPGKDETFDPQRFALWLEVLLETGEEFAAQTLAELDEDLVTLALHRHLLVVDVDALGAELSEREEGDDLVEKALESALSHELDGFLVIARDPDTFDAILSVLVALDRDRHAELSRLLERCCHLSTSYIEDNGGLYEVLTAEESLEGDVAFEREKRREREGFVAPSQAASFLALARQSPLDQIAAATTDDPVTRAYFRAYAPAPLAHPPAAARPAASDLLTVLEEAEVLPAPARRPLLEATGTREVPPLQHAIAALPTADRERCLLELNYLTNVMVAGAPHRGRAYRPVEAAEAVMEIAGEGLAHLSARGGTPAGLIGAHGLVKLFRIGWHLRGLRP
jgi:hypothetical protein